MDGFKCMTLQEFSDRLASDAPAPGGGSAAALAAVFAASLAAMVFALTIGKKHYKGMPHEVKEKIENAARELPGLTAEFHRLMDADTKAFLAVMEAFRLPKRTAAEIDVRSGQIKAAYRQATVVPLELARKASQLFDCLHIAAEHGNPNAVSDAGVGALYALTAVEGAVLNVRSNISGLKAPETAAAIEAEIAVLLGRARRRQAEIMEMVDARL